MLKNKQYLFMILAIALAIRLYFFMGLLNNDPQDDMIYLKQINDVLDGKYNITR
ncbi:MAG: hypothetical protein HGA85_07595, partial [Nanoarchaeota archaeon]|nr:hypothetical protein [Nanoarchaeota archaeon]